MANQISPMLSPRMIYVDSVGDRDEMERRVLNLASMIAMEETITVGVNAYNDNRKERVRQRILYMSKVPTIYSG